MTEYKNAVQICSAMDQTHHKPHESAQQGHTTATATANATQDKAKEHAEQERWTMPLSAEEAEV